MACCDCCVKLHNVINCYVLLLTVKALCNSMYCYVLLDGAMKRKGMLSSVLLYHAMVCCPMLFYGVVRYGMVWYAMVRYGVRCMCGIM